MTEQTAEYVVTPDGRTICRNCGGALHWSRDARRWVHDLTGANHCPESDRRADTVRNLEWLVGVFQNESKYHEARMNGAYSEGLAEGYRRAADLVKEMLAEQIDGPEDDHEPDNERGVWCCQEHREAFYAGALIDGQECIHLRSMAGICLDCGTEFDALNDGLGRDEA